MSALKNVNAPHNQEFNVGACPCKSKKNSWWNPKSNNFWRSRTKQAKKADAFVAAQD